MKNNINSTGLYFHKQVKCSNGIYVDEKIAETIEQLWIKNYETEYSCQGGPGTINKYNEIPTSTYISINNWDNKIMSKIKESQFNIIQKYYYIQTKNVNEKIINTEIKKPDTILLNKSNNIEKIKNPIIINHKYYANDDVNGFGKTIIRFKPTEIKLFLSLIKVIQ